MVKALRVHTVGGRHHPQLEEVALPHPGCNEVEVRHTAIGLNYPDVEDCTGGGHHGRHSMFTPGSSAVGVITELGTGVLDYQIGQRVGYVNPPYKGAFSEANKLSDSYPLECYRRRSCCVAVLRLDCMDAVEEAQPPSPGRYILVHNVYLHLASERRSFSVAVPVLGDYVKHREELLQGSQLLLELYKAGDIKVEIASKLPLNMISEVLDAVTKGEVAGSCILNPPIPDPKNYYS